MSTYYRLFDKFRSDVISLALFTDEDPNFRPRTYQRETWGIEIHFRFRGVKLIDYLHRMKALERDQRPFALVVRAFLSALKRGKNVNERYILKKRLLIELLHLRVPRQTILAL